MGQTTDMAMIADLRKELEREAEEENIPILRRAERKLLLEAVAAGGPKKKMGGHPAAGRRGGSRSKENTGSGDGHRLFCLASGRAFSPGGN